MIDPDNEECLLYLPFSLEKWRKSTAARFILKKNLQRNLESSNDIAPRSK
jgi:hypothetical protein